MAATAIAAVAGVVSFYFSQVVSQAAEARAMEMELRIAEQQERAANAERQLIHLKEQQIPRRASFRAGPFRDALATAGAPRSVIIWYKPEDEEAKLFALGLAEQLGYAGWHPTTPMPIPREAVSQNYAQATPEELARMSAIERIGAAPTSLSIFSKESESVPAATLFEALIAGSVSPMWRSADPRLADGVLRLVIGEKP